MKKLLSVILALFIIAGTIPSFETTSYAADESVLFFELNAAGTAYSVTACRQDASGEVDIPDTYNGLPVTIIYTYAFYGCLHLTSITIPNSVTLIGEDAFEYCDSLKHIYYWGTETEWNRISVSYKNDSLINFAIHFIIGKEYLTFELNAAGTSYLVTACRQDASGEIFIPDVYNSLPVTEISDRAFENCSKLNAAIIPDSITSIGALAFYNCSELYSVTIPDSVTSIGSSAFGGCESLKEVYISDVSAWCSIRFLNQDSNPLYYASNLYLNEELVTNLAIPETVTEILSYAFYNCDSIVSVSVSKKLTSINYDAFTGCDNLAYVYYTGDEDDWRWVSGCDLVIRNAALGYNCLDMFSSQTSSIFGVGSTWETFAFIPLSDGKYVFYITDTPGTGILGSGTPSIMRLYSATVADFNYESDINDEVEPEILLAEVSGSDSRIEMELQAGEVYALKVGKSKTSILNSKTNFEVSRINTLSFDANGGENAPLSIEKEDDSNITISNQIPTKQCYNFIGWSLDKNASWAAYFPGGTYSEIGDRTLYAVWQDNHSYSNWVIDYYGKYNQPGKRHKTCSECGYVYYDNNVDYQYFDVSFITNGGSCDVSTKSVMNEAPIGKLPVAEKSKYLFKGWTYTNGGTDYVSPEDIVTKDLTLYGSWDLIGPERIEITNMPLKTVYYVNDALETRGLKLLVTNNDGSTKTITSGFETEYDFSTSGETDVTIRYTENNKIAETTFAVFVNEPGRIYSDALEVNAGETIDVPVYIENNPGIAGFTLYMTYDDSVFTPVCVNGDDLSGCGMLDDNIGYSSDNIVQVSWSGTENYYDDCELFNITFEVSDALDVRGNYNFDITYEPSDTFDENMNEVTLYCEGATVTVINGEKPPVELGGDSVEAVAGKYVDIPVNVLNNSGLSGSDIAINYNSDVLTFVKVTNGLATVTADSSIADEISVNLKTVKESSEGTLFTVRFEVKEYYSGKENLIITSSISNVFSDDIVVDIKNPMADKLAQIYSDEISGDIGDTVLVPVYISNNHGMLGFKIRVTFDSSMLTPAAYCKAESIVSGCGTISNNISANLKKGRNYFDIIFYGDEEFCESGKMFTLKFKLNETIPMNTSLKIDYIQADTYTEVDGVEKDVELDCNKVNFEIGGAFVQDNIVYLNKLQDGSTIDLLEWISTEDTGSIKNINPTVGSFYGTGTTFDYIADDGTTQEYNVVVKGDVDGDGVLDVIDSFIVQQASNQFKELSDIEQNAADLTGDSEVTVEDYSATINLALS